ncbi:MAG: hypothetical protein RBU21_09485, partial [FCB group bacterium]|nr:hypothetical protein [FCB group bacterium]
MKIDVKKWFVGSFATLLVVMTTLIFVDSYHKPNARAVIGMAGGLIVLWVFLGGGLMVRYREPVCGYVRGLPGGWKTKFVLFATVLALIEEAITVTMTNLAPLFGVKVGEAYITASANWLDVVALHSVVMFVPLFIGVAFLLGRYAFTPFAIFVLFGVVGTTAEALYSGSPATLLQFPQWLFVYGLMVYHPAYCVPVDRAARPVRPWHYLVALPYVFAVALPFVVVIGFVITSVLHHPGIH